MINDVKSDAKTRMGKSVDSFKSDLTKVRTGRAHPSLIEHLMIPYYGSDTPITQVANVSIADARTLQVQPWEKDMVAPIEKAIMNADLGLNPNTAGQVIRIPLPPLTEERRKELIKVVRGEAENAKVAVRNIRRDANSTLKDLVKEKEISEDDERRAQDEIQKLTDEHVNKIDAILSEKEEELMEI
ncbi:ribosome recycling factor [Pleionea sediminis]|uniref:ribosome recycling factor n=1 Tax=Pleionea sediminis TaxID=2569479 RepID=UPI0011857445